MVTMALSENSDFSIQDNSRIFKIFKAGLRENMKN